MLRGELGAGTSKGRERRARIAVLSTGQFRERDFGQTQRARHGRAQCPQQPAHENGKAQKAKENHGGQT